MARIRIVNFDQYNPRKDRTRHYWFKVENGIIYSESLDELEADQKWFWIFLLAYAKEKQCDTFELKMKYFVKHSGVSEKKITAALDILNQNKTIELLPDDENILETNGSHEAHQMSPNGCLDKRREEERREEKKREEPAAPKISPEDLLSLWNDRRGTLPGAETLSDERRRKAIAQIKKYSDVSHWNSTLSKFLASEFCVNEWKPGFDDFLKEPIRIKALEGKYDRKLKAVANTAAEDDWRATATLVKQTLDKYGDWLHHRSDVEALLGPIVYQTCVRAGIRNLRMLPADKFYHQNLIGLLKNAREVISV